MQTPNQSTTPTPDHIQEAAEAFDEAAHLRREVKALERDLAVKRELCRVATQRLLQLSREAAEIEGAAA